MQCVCIDFAMLWKLLPSVVARETAPVIRPIASTDRWSIMRKGASGPTSRATFCSNVTASNNGIATVGSSGGTHSRFPAYNRSDTLYPFFQANVGLEKLPRRVLGEDDVTCLQQTTFWRVESNRSHKFDIGQWVGAKHVLKIAFVGDVPRSDHILLSCKRA